jgi:hypothetical protein
MKKSKTKVALDEQLQAAKLKIISLNKTLNGIDYLDDTEAKRFTIALINGQKENWFTKYPILRKDEECIKPEPQRPYRSSLECREAPECGPTPES